MTSSSDAGSPSSEQDKAQAAKVASERVLMLERAAQPYTLGLGTGSTTRYLVEALGRLFAAGRLPRLTGCVTTSMDTRDLALLHHLPLLALDAVDGSLTLAIDGADEIDPALNLIKGAGGALLREHEVEKRAATLLIIADDRKLSPKLGSQSRLPVEVEPSAVEEELAVLSHAGARPALRRTGDGSPFVTDNGNWILDCDFRPLGIGDPKELAARLEARPAVKAHGLFLGMADEAIVVGTAGVRFLRRP